jgi:hypothetical protein
MSETFNDRPKQRRVLVPKRAPSGNERRYALQQRHFDELIEFDRKHDPRRIEHEERMRAFYKTDAYRGELRALERKRSLFRKGRERMEELRATIEDAVRCEYEAMREFDYGVARERDKIIERQAHEREALEHTLDGRPAEQKTEESAREREARERMERADQVRAQNPHLRRQWRWE